MPEPFKFSVVYAKAITEMFDDGEELRCVDIGTLISMKKAAGRPKDLDDVARLEILKHEEI
ncbi:MAG: hypothetical protein HQL32_13395 [Planctomycetes bacterium]|nr:hypothetical protein [Planctomycetota bacterium]